MWHLKTRLGVFWVVPVEGDKDKYMLGINDEDLALYTDVEKAVQDVHNHATGFLKWDLQSVVGAPMHISEWDLGEPETWKVYKS